ncbi:MAG: rubredoxin [Rikenellaceae bacterium]|nr:rubredoxin [Rikenellaceae bacterium]
MKFKCIVCDYIHEGDEAPEQCPLCHVGPEMFEIVEEDEKK